MLCSINNGNDESRRMRILTCAAQSMSAGVAQLSTEIVLRVCIEVASGKCIFNADVSCSEIVVVLFLSEASADTDTAHAHRLQFKVVGVFGCYSPTISLGY